MTQKEKILKIIKKKSISRKELLKKSKSLEIGENRLDVLLHQLRKKGLIEKIDKKYHYINPFSKILEIEDGKERELAMYKMLIRLITGFAKYKPLELLREAYYINNKRGKK